MKTTAKSLTSLGLGLVLVFIGINTASSQSCTNCYQCYSSSSLYSSAFGKNDTASANYTVAFGLSSRAKSLNAIAMGSYNISQGQNSITLGGNLSALQTKSIVIGFGYDPSSGSRLENNLPYTLMVGFGSIYPTLFVGRSEEYNKTGKIGIGNITNPQAKLHIKADVGEVAAMYVEPNSWAAGSSAVVQLGNQYHGLIGSYDRGLEFKTQKNYIFYDGNLGIGTTNPIHLFQVAFNGSQFYLDNNTLTFEAQGGGNCPTIKLISSLRNTWNIKHDFTSSSLQFRYNDAITGLNLLNDGTVGIGTLNTSGYKLAVYGKIRTQEVMVEHLDQWYDHVFNENYPLLDIEDLRIYIELNNCLPQIPSEQEVKENGIELAKMNGLLLQKIEELTLYIINQEERIKALEEIMKVNEYQTIEK